MPVPTFPPAPTDTETPAAVSTFSVPFITLTDSVGDVLEVTGKYLMMPGAQGLGVGPVELFSDPLPQDDGSMFRGVRLGDNDIFLPIALLADDPEDLRVLRERIVSLCHPLRLNRTNQVTVTLAWADGERRSATGRFVAGIPGNYGSDEAGGDWQILGVVIRCLDPFWYSEPVSLGPFRVAEAAKDFLSEWDDFFPIELAASQVMGEATITNPGDVDTFPTWYIEGPGSELTLTNEATGKTLVLTTTVDVVNIDTRLTSDTALTVTDGDDVNLFEFLSDDSSLWPLVPGEQTVTMTLTGATEDSGIWVSFATRRTTSG